MSASLRAAACASYVNPLLTYYGAQENILKQGPAARGRWRSIMPFTTPNDEYLMSFCTTLSETVNITAGECD